MAVATLWLLRVGGEADARVPEPTLLAVAPSLAQEHAFRQQVRRRQRTATRLRLVSIFRRGWIQIVVALLQHTTLPTGAFVPEPWPALPSTQLPLSALDHVA